MLFGHGADQRREDLRKSFQEPSQHADSVVLSHLQASAGAGPGELQRHLQRTSGRFTVVDRTLPYSALLEFVVLALSGL